jgi:hypothetical protein
MVQKLSELRVSSSFEAGSYKAGMDQKIAADRAGAASSNQLGAAVATNYQKISQAGNVLEKLSRQYVTGYAQTAKFESAINSLGRGVETGVVPIERTGVILDGIYAKFGRTADAAVVAGRGYAGLAREVETLNAKLAAAGAGDQFSKWAAEAAAASGRIAAGMSLIGASALEAKRESDRLLAGMASASKVPAILQRAEADAAAAAAGRIAVGMSAIGTAALEARKESERLIAGMTSANAVPAILQKAQADAAAAASGRIATGLSSIGAAALAARKETERLIAGMSSFGNFDAVAARAAAAAEASTRMSAGMSSMGAAALATQQMNERLIRGMSSLGGTLQTTGRQAALSSFAMTNLAFQINDVATMAALGMDPMRIFATQVGQIYQILATGQGGVRGSFSYLKDTIVGMITPLRLVTAAVVGFGVAAATALNSAINRGIEVETALSGIGRMSGVTATDIEAIAAAAREAGVATVGQARAMALALVGTGAISAEVSEDIIGIGRRIAKTFGEDLTAATERMAAAFADPARGVDDLNKRLGVYDDRTRQLIKSLAAQNNLTDAQKLLLEGLERGIVSSAGSTNMLERAWHRTTEAMSDYWDKFAKLADRAAGGGTLEEQLERSKAAMRDNSNLENGLFGWLTGDRYWEAVNNVVKLTQEIEKAKAAAAESVNVRESNWVGDFSRKMLPEFSDRQRMQDDFKRLTENLKDPNVRGRLDDPTVAAAEKATELLASRIAYYKTNIELAREDHTIALQNIAARSTAQRAEIAYQETLQRARREDYSTAEEKASLARDRVLAEGREAVRRANEQRLIASDHSVEQARAELALVGQTASARERELALLQTRQQLEAEALRTEGDRNAYDRGHLKIMEDRVKWQAELNRLIQQESTLKDLAFERAQMGRSEREQNVYGRLNSLGILTNGEIVGSQAELIAGQIRFNEVMRISQDSSKEFASGFIRDMRDGVSATEALANAMNRLADRFLDMAMDQGFSAFFQPFSQAVAKGATGHSATDTLTGWGGSTSFGDWLTSVVPAYHRGGIAGQPSGLSRRVPSSVFDGAPRYHGGGIAGLLPNEVPAILERGERVVRNGESAGGAVNVSMPITIHAPGADAAALARVEAALRQIQRELPATILNTVRDGRQRNRV